MDRKGNVIPHSKKYAGCIAKIDVLENGRVVLTLQHQKEKGYEGGCFKSIECKSAEDAKRLLQLSGQQFQKVQETIIYVVKE